MKTNIFFPFLILLSLSLSGCTITADKTVNTTSQEYSGNENFSPDDIVYTVDFFETDGRIGDIGVCGDELYFDIDGSKFYKWNAEEGTEPEEIYLQLPEDKLLEYWGIQPTENGEVYMIINFKEHEKPWGEPYLYLYKFDQTGKEVFHKNITNYQLYEGWWGDTALDQEGNLYDYGYSEIQVYDPEGNLKQSVSLEEDDVCGIAIVGDQTYLAIERSGEKEIYTFSPEEGMSAQPFMENNIFGETLSWHVGLDGFGTLNFFGSDEGFIVRSGNSIYEYDMAGSKKELVNLLNCGIEPAKIIQVNGMANGRIAILLGDRLERKEFAILTPVKRSELPEKTTLVLGTLSADVNLQQIVSRFNRSQQDCQIEVREYFDKEVYGSSVEEGLEAGRTALHLDIVSGRCPDLLNLEYDDLIIYKEAGLLIDLLPYVEGNENLDIMPSILEAYTFEESGLTGIPNVVQVRTLGGRQRNLGKRNQWSLEEMMTFMEETAGDLNMGISASQMLEYCFTYNQSAFVDFDNYSCSFDSAEFQELLAFCSKFPATGGQTDSTVWAAGLDEEEKGIYEMVIDRADDVTLLYQIYETPELSFPGFPTLDGTAGHLLEAKEGSYSITTTCQAPEKAWDFIEFLLKDYSKTFMEGEGPGFPVDKEAREGYFAKAMEHPWHIDPHTGKEFPGWRYAYYGEIGRVIYIDDPVREVWYYTPFQEEVEPIYQLLEQARMPKERDSVIMDIMLEEAALCFSGQVSIEATAEKIQNRVSIYLAEQE